MQKVLISVPDDLIGRMKAVIPPRQRSKILTKLLEDEVRTRETKLYQCARKVESDQSLNAEMEDWNTTIGDGIDDLREAAYAEMAKDKDREKEALKWAENTFKDLDHEAR